MGDDTTTSGTTGSTTDPSLAGNPTVRAARIRLERKRLDLEQRRLELEDRAARTKLATDSLTSQVTAAKQLLPASLDTEIEKDTLARSGDLGLAEVFAGRAVEAAADDVADLVIEATQTIPAVEILVTSDPTVFADAEAALLLRTQLGGLLPRLRQALGERASEARPADLLRTALPDLPEGVTFDLETVPDAGVLGIVGVPAVAMAGALANLVPSALGLITKLTARQYDVTGAAVPDPVLSFDVRVARHLRTKATPDPRARVVLERFWSAADLDAPLAVQLAQVAAGLEVLGPVLTEAETAEADADQVLAGTTAALDAARARLAALAGTASPDAAADTSATTWMRAWQDTSEDVTRLEGLLGEQGRTATAAGATADALRTLAGDIEAVLSAALTPGESTPSPLLAALRGDWLRSQPHRVLLFVRATPAGIDQVIETKLGPDRRVVLAGATVEFAAVDATGRLLASGAFDPLLSASFNLTRPEQAELRRVAYEPVSNATRDPARSAAAPVPAQSS